jgi:hypothetical protein
MRELQSLRPDLVTIQELGHSGLGREMYGLVISNKNSTRQRRPTKKDPRTNNDKLAFVLLGAQHAREVSLIRVFLLMTILTPDTFVTVDRNGHFTLSLSCPHCKRDRRLFLIAPPGRICLCLHCCASWSHDTDDSVSFPRISTSYPCPTQTDTIIHGKQTDFGECFLTDILSLLQVPADLHDRYKTRQKMDPKGKCFGLDMNRFVATFIPTQLHE